MSMLRSRERKISLVFYPNSSKVENYRQFSICVKLGLVIPITSDKSLNKKLFKCQYHLPYFKMGNDIPIPQTNISKTFKELYNLPFFCCARRVF